MTEKTCSKTESHSEVRVLFVGNSYTAGIKHMFKQMAPSAFSTNSTFMFVWGGGASLQKLIDNGRAPKLIQKQDWDYVVLQEQSLRPALSEKSELSFHKSVDELVAQIREVGAEPLLYMTWGRRDGLEMGGDLIFDFETMNKKLSDAYRKAAKRNGIQVVPVGEAWAQVREKDSELGRELYAPDGSHPSDKGAFLATCVFLRALSDLPLDQLAMPEGLDQDDCMLISDIVMDMPAPATD